jgi:hypothetical protein
MVIIRIYFFANRLFVGVVKVRRMSLFYESALRTSPTNKRQVMIGIIEDYQ